MKLILVLSAAFVAGGCAPPPATLTPLPVNTAEIDVAPDALADSLLADISSLDSTIIVDMRYATANNFTGAKLPGYEGNRAFLRSEAAAALAAVQKKLHTRHLGLKIFDAYRPVRATEAMVLWTARVNRPDLLRDGYIASRSRHNLGVAVDLTLVDLRTGKELEMGTPFDTFSPAAHAGSAGGVAAENRKILSDAMSAEGFTPYSGEWWHFSFRVDHPVRFDRVIR